jgi:uncharacterized membrane protein
MIWVGGAVTLGALAIQVLRDGDPDSVARFVRGMRVIGVGVLAPGTLAVAGFGIWLVADSDAWGFRQTWVWLGLVLLVAAFLVGAVFQSRTMIRAERVSAAGDSREAVRQLGRWLWGLGLIVVLLLAAVWDMVFKPGL